MVRALSGILKVLFGWLVVLVFGGIIGLVYGLVLAGAFSKLSGSENAAITVIAWLVFVLIGAFVVSRSLGENINRKKKISFMVVWAMIPLPGIMLGLKADSNLVLLALAVNSILQYLTIRINPVLLEWPALKPEET